MNLRAVKSMGRRLQEWLERGVLGTRLQEWLWRGRHLYRRNWARGYLETFDHPHRTQVVEAVAAFAPVDSVLEVGCASGANLLRLRERFPTARLMGLDINQQAIATARQHFAEHGDERVELVVGKADRLVDFPDACADVVLVDAVLMFIAPDRIKAVIAEMCRVARKGLVLNEYHRTDYADGKFDGGRWIYDLVTLLQQQRPQARIQVEQSAFTGGAWDRYGTLIMVRL